MESWNPVTAITAEAEESMKVSSPTTRAGQPACGKQGYGWDEPCRKCLQWKMCLCL